MYKSARLAAMRATLFAAVAVSVFVGPRAHAIFSFCGDGIVEPEFGEVCDDAIDVCCFSCQIADAGSPCLIATPLCSTAAVCDGTGSDSSSCVSEGAPLTGCRHALKSLLVLKSSSSPTTSPTKLVWKWLKGEQTSLEELGMPTGTTSYALCVFAGPTNTPIRQIQTQYDSPSFWSPISDKGYKYSFGTKVILRAGDQGKAKALMRSYGPNPPFNLPLPVTVQLHNSANDVCFEGVYDTGDIIKNDAHGFKAVAQ